ncbi:MAG: hypothetical protein ACD_55C00099G0005 [uncultured bacterium]|uniref:Uncharacterized protein n=1 Tax=Citrifermentans bemidjiense (strain ATCC BAA-1014 / DSM 16622 / JCM 12645 / Bem) TaxID=404380 RepID=B5EGV3_CITBB|nr:hypothetical protein [Citrifermentans bemidjiense]ACH39586.1 hypothetical protein Gbem_2578 [Citrifermentans bemidjiense Bem]EKD59248.1 MAG: hypothetical protein ACD_55C00099G0005 [uncultured bacterium]
MISLLKSLLGKTLSVPQPCSAGCTLRKELEDQRLLLGKLLAERTKGKALLERLGDAEFKVFSQWGDDGIIQYLINNLDIRVKKFIEFGVSDYREANTRFLLQNDNWSGLVMDCSEDNVNYIKNDDIYWKYDLTAQSCFITAENINGKLSQAGFSDEIGLLHIDVDGNDYWIWKAIDVVDPLIVIMEYNSLFGIERPITVPYDPGFDRFASHHSGIFAGASLLALCNLAQSKGYAFVGSNSAGNNAYFVREDKVGAIRTLSPQQGYVASKFREHRDEQGNLTFIPGHDAVESIRGMQVFNTTTQTIEEL